MKKSYKSIDKDYLDYVDNLLKKKPKKSEYKGKANQTLKNKNNNLDFANDKYAEKELLKFELYL